MSDLVPLILLWAIGTNKRGGSGTMPPMWPSAASPPPPPPLPLPSSAAPESDTPVSDLLKQALNVDTPAAAKKAEKAIRRAGKPLRDKLNPKPKKKASLLSRVTSSASSARATPAFLDYAPPNSDVSVSDVQKVLIRRGYTSIKKDGLYGPKTELAWKTLANGMKLSPAIVRRSPKIARVNQETFTALSIP
jgi:hypothetical protein